MSLSTSGAAILVPPAAVSTEGTPMADDNGSRNPLWFRALTTFGLPTFLLLGILYAGWQGGAWLGREVILPVSTRHIQFLEETTKIGKENATNSQLIAGAITDLKNTSTKQTEILSSIHRKLFNEPTSMGPPEKKP